VTRATVAIILSNYNHRRYLKESLGAICGQSRPADEIVVIDDGSTDDSVTVIEEFASRYPALRFIRNHRNLGLQASIARALPLVTSEYLVWAASDDRLLPDFLEASMAVLERHPRAGLCFSELSVLKGDTGEIERFAAVPWVAHTFDLSDLPEYLAPADVIRRMQRAYLPITSNSVVVRREALLALGGYPAALEWFSDSFAYTVIALRHGACVVPRTLVLIRSNPGSYSQGGMRDRGRQAVVLTALLHILARPDYRDIRRAFRRCPSNFSPYGTLMLELQLRRIRDWELFVSYLVWKVREYRRGHRLSWARTFAELTLRLLASVRVRSIVKRAVRRVQLLQRDGLVDRTVRFLPGLLGRRGYGWTESLPHRMLAVLSRALYSRRARLARFGYMVMSALLKHRELVYAGRMNFVATLRGPISQHVLTNVALWQTAIFEQPEIPPTLRIHGHVRIVSDPDEVQLDRLFSLLFVSNAFTNLSLFWDEKVAAEAMPTTLTKIEQRRAADLNDVFDLDSPRQAGEAERQGSRRALPLFEPLRAATNYYLKVAHPRAFVVALSFPEDDDGFCDAALEAWLPHLARFRQEFPIVAFCLLNRTMLGQRQGEPPTIDVAPVRSRGLALPDAIALAQVADSFVGCLDSFGLAALAAGRSGVYVDARGPERSEPERLQWVVSDGSPEPCLGLLRRVIQTRQPDRTAGRPEDRPHGIDP